MTIGGNSFTTAINPSPSLNRACVNDAISIYPNHQSSEVVAIISELGASAFNEKADGSINKGQFPKRLISITMTKQNH